jgi:predicted metal-binding protein
MSKPVLFVCTSCNTDAKEDLEPSEDTCLLDKLNELNSEIIV